MTAVIPRPIRPYPVRRSPRGAAFLPEDQRRTRSVGMRLIAWRE
jgi:hypothetical protein